MKFLILVQDKDSNDGVFWLLYIIFWAIATLADEVLSRLATASSDTSLTDQLLNLILILIVDHDSG